MIHYVTPTSLDNGKLGFRVEAESAEDAARIAVETRFGEHADEAMVVRWNVKFGSKGDVTFSRLTEVEPSSGAKSKAEPAKAEPAKAEPAKAAEPAKTPEPAKADAKAAEPAKADARADAKAAEPAKAEAKPAGKS